MTTKSELLVNPQAQSEPQISGNTDETRDALLAGVAAGPYVGAASVIANFGRSTLGDLSLVELAQVLMSHSTDAGRGDQSHAEAMLCAQAAALNTMFAELARRGAANMGQNLATMEGYLKLALRAQNQCRATLEALAAIKNPPVVFAKQANIAHGPQQVNNDTANIARACESEKAPNELLETDDHGQGLDTGATRSVGEGQRGCETPEAREAIRTQNLSNPARKRIQV